MIRERRNPHKTSMSNERTVRGNAIEVHITAGAIEIESTELERERQKKQTEQI